tara:strand:- start:7531 stop:9513 length:1983 start_codon:yes stop_codon:yes gene_type:complete
MASLPLDPLLGLAVNLLAEMIADSTEAPRGKPMDLPPGAGTVAVHSERLRTKHVVFPQTALQSYRFAVRHLVRVLPLLCTESAALARAEPLLKWLLAYEHHVPILIDPSTAAKTLDRFTTGRAHLFDGVPSGIRTPSLLELQYGPEGLPLAYPKLGRFLFLDSDMQDLMPLVQWDRHARTPMGQQHNHPFQQLLAGQAGHALKLQIRETALLTLLWAGQDTEWKDTLLEMWGFMKRYETWSGVPADAPWAVRFFVVGMMMDIAAVAEPVHTVSVLGTTFCIPCTNHQCRRVSIVRPYVTTRRARTMLTTRHSAPDVEEYRVAPRNQIGAEYVLSDREAGMKLVVFRGHIANGSDDSEDDEDDEHPRHTEDCHEYEQTVARYATLMGRPVPNADRPRLDDGSAECVARSVMMYWITMLGSNDPRHGDGEFSIGTSSELFLLHQLRAVVVGDPERVQGCCSEACAAQWERSYQSHERILHARDFVVPTVLQLSVTCRRNRLPSARVLFEEAVALNGDIQRRMRKRDAARASPSSGPPVHADPHDLDMHIICMRNTHTLLMYAASLVADTSFFKKGTRRRFVPGSFSSASTSGSYEGLHTFATSYQLYGRAVQSIWRIFGLSKGCVRPELTIATTLITTKVPDAGSACATLFDKVKFNVLTIF